MNWITSNTDVIIAFAAIAALLTSAYSIRVAARSLEVQQLHNLKSVAPLAEVAIGDYENKLVVSLVNAGPGPMIIERIEVSRGARTKDRVVSWMPDLLPPFQWTTFSGDLTDRCFSPGETLNLVLLEGDPEDSDFSKVRDDVRLALSKLRIDVTYKDIYGQLHDSRGRSLDWFGRT